MAKRKGVVAFDFDGVIGDSVLECYVQSVRAFADVGGKVKASKAAEKAFRAARPLITKAEHFFTVMRLIQQNPRIRFGRMRQGDFNAEVGKDEAKVKDFTEKFYARREEMKKISYKEWIALQKSFPKIAKFIAKVQKGNEVFIATTKDAKSVAELLAAYGIKIPAANIVAKEFSKDKKEQLQEIARKAGVQASQVVLVEDAVEQIRDARKIGAKGVLVRWGYSTRKQRKEIRGEGIPIIKKANWFGRRKIRKAQRRPGR